MKLWCMPCRVFTDWMFDLIDRCYTELNCFKSQQEPPFGSRRDRIPPEDPFLASDESSDDSGQLAFSSDEEPPALL